MLEPASERNPTTLIQQASKLVATPTAQSTSFLRCIDGCWGCSYSRQGQVSTLIVGKGNRAWKEMPQNTAIIAAWRVPIQRVSMESEIAVQAQLAAP